MSDLDLGARLMILEDAVDNLKSFFGKSYRSSHNNNRLTRRKSAAAAAICSCVSDWSGHVGVSNNRLGHG